MAEKSTVAADLLRPVLRRICEYWLFRRAGAEPSAEQALDAVSADLVAVRRRAAEDPALASLFERIEEPLVFFIDYTIKEGGFKFSEDWREMARNFGELSGDEKFFELLEKAKTAPNAGEALSVFFLLLGLGFDGMYRAENWRAVEAMQDCAKRLPPQAASLDLNSERLSPPPKAPKTNRPVIAGARTAKIALAASVVLALAALGWNGWVLSESVEPFSDEVTLAAYASAPQFGGIDSAQTEAASEAEDASAARNQSELPESAELQDERSLSGPAVQLEASPAVSAAEAAQESKKAQAPAIEPKAKRRADAAASALPASAAEGSGLPAQPAAEAGWLDISAAEEPVAAKGGR